MLGCHFAMNSSRIQDAVVRAIDPTTEGYQSAASKIERLPAEYQQSFLDHELSKSVAMALQDEPEFEHGLMIYSENGSSGMNADRAAVALVSKARLTSPAVAIEWLQKVLSTQEARGYCIMALWGIPRIEPTPLASDVDLVPVEAIPESVQKKWLLDLGDPSAMARSSPPSLLGVPEVALLHRTTVRPYLWNLKDGSPPAQAEPLRAYYLLDDVRRALTAVGPCAPIQAAYWFQFEDADLEDARLGRGWSHHHHEVSPMMLESLGPFSAPLAARTVQAYLTLQPGLKGRVAIALDRLNQAIRRRGAGDQALDVCIALETLLADGQGENTFKVALRAALLTEVDLSDRKRVRGVVGASYVMRSAMVHNGKVPDSVKVVGRGDMSAANVSREAMQACGRVLLEILKRSALPNWYETELGAAVL